MIFKWGEKSEGKISTLDPKLRCVVRKALSYDVTDMTIISGRRDLQEQKKLVEQGYSQKLDSKHLPNKHGWSDAVDLAPYPVDWRDTERFCVLAGLMFAAASELSLKIRWGGDWDGDLNLIEEKFRDYGHFELIEVE
jgi:peptidoglycan L-alanyl-D-glutamate endopeptidase CwlK